MGLAISISNSVEGTRHNATGCPGIIGVFSHLPSAALVRQKVVRIEWSL
jgi:hypothetical protein